jgi:multicomponent Na+:H+ antiporter subunit E
MRYIFSFCLLFAFWLILSGNFDSFHLSMGVISTLIVTLWTGDLLFPNPKICKQSLLAGLLRLPGFLLWLSKEIVLSNLHVIYVALHPRMQDLLHPQMIEFDTTLKTELSQFVLANSITLTPGTITVRIQNGRFLVHALTRQTAEGLPGEMEQRVAKLFGEGLE